MNTKIIDGKCFARMLAGGAALLAAHKEELNALNVFPVADGDTGTNMLHTLEGGLAGIDKIDACGIGELSLAFSRKTLLSARGNSGVILSQIFAGITEGLEKYETADAKTLAEAYRHGISRSYAAVMNPTEGTILTVFRESTEYAATHIDDSSSIEDFFKFHIDEARRSLASTKEILPALAEADVVDSGAAGYLYISEGMYSALSGEAIPEYKPAVSEDKSAPDIELFSRNDKLKFGYCTEFLIRLTVDKVDPDSFDIKEALDALEELGGESIVAYKQDDILKIHVHTFTPGAIMTRMQNFGEFLTVKIENMELGHSDNGKPKNEKIKTEKSKRTKPFSVVAVAAGDGISALFTHMGAERIICGGQTSNPSIEEFVEAFEQCESGNIIVLPNNKNIILAARQAAALYKDADVYVVETKNLMQGYGALSVINPGITDVDLIVSSARRAANDVVDGEITKAVRDAHVDGLEIKCGDYMVISEGKIIASAKQSGEAVLKMLETADTDMYEIISLFVGKDVSANERAELTKKISDLYPDLELSVYEGGQEIYDYLIALE